MHKDDVFLESKLVHLYPKDTRPDLPRGVYHVINVPPFDVDDFSSWKDRFLVYLDGLEPYLLKILENGSYESDSDVEEDTRRNSEFLADLNVEFHDRALLANQNRFYKRSRRVIINTAGRIMLTEMRSKTYQRRDKDRLENKNTYEDKY
ncbi:hypothetical protein Tco_1146811 [Tanacetum coccineum]